MLQLTPILSHSFQVSSLNIPLFHSLLWWWELKHASEKNANLISKENEKIVAFDVVFSFSIFHSPHPHHLLNSLKYFFSLCPSLYLFVRFSFCFPFFTSQPSLFTLRLRIARSMSCLRNFRRKCNDNDDDNFFMLKRCSFNIIKVKKMLLSI